MEFLSNDENYWSTRKKKLFPTLQNIEFTCAMLAIPMYFPEFEQIRHDTYSAMKGIDFFREKVDAVRGQLASLLHCSDRQVFLFNNTTDSFREVLRNAPLKKGDELIMTTEEYGSMEATIEHECQTKSVSFKKIHPKNLSCLDEVVSEKTCCIFLSHITHSTGMVLNVEDITRQAQKRRIYTIESFE